MMSSPKSRSRKQPDLTIVIPALREEKRIGATLEELAEFLQHEPLFKDKDVEVLVVSADSDDNTHGVVRSRAGLFKRFVFLRPGPKVGKGRDVQYGMLRAKGRAVIFMDADLATPLRHLPKFYRSFEKGADVVVATRNLRKHHKKMLRRMLSNAGNLLFRFVGGVWIEDSQCGFKLFSQHATQLCFGRMTIMGWGFDMEVLAIAKIHKLKIVTHRVNDWRAVPGGIFESDVLGGALKSSLKSLDDLRRIFVNRIKGVYAAPRD